MTRTIVAKIGHDVEHLFQSINPMNCSGDRSQIPRLIPDQPFPPYSFVPGHHPHPMSDPLGHSYGQVMEPVEPPDPMCWSQCRPYLRGIDLFNHGYYWEAHEEWESLWHSFGRQGEAADFVKGLIQLAVAGVKVRQGFSEVVKTHAHRAEDIFNRLSSSKAVSNRQFMGLSLAELANRAHEIVDNVNVIHAHPELPVAIVFSFVLRPHPYPVPKPFD